MLEKRFGYRTAAFSESHGQYHIGVVIELTENIPMTDELRDAVSRARRDLEQAATTALYSSDPNELSRASEERRQLMECFTVGSILHVESISNGYCSQGCCRHRPWFIVHTNRGPIEIGWRKRVINIDWRNLWKKPDANDLFPSEIVTKEQYSIHAWGYEKAAEYLTKILA